MRECARELRIPFSEVQIEQFDDPYQVPRVLRALLDAPRLSGGLTSGLVERVMNTPLLTLQSVGFVGCRLLLRGCFQRSSGLVTGTSAARLMSRTQKLSHDAATSAAPYTRSAS